MIFIYVYTDTKTAFDISIWVLTPHVGTKSDDVLLPHLSSHSDNLSVAPLHSSLQTLIFTISTFTSDRPSNQKSGLLISAFFDVGRILHHVL